MRRTRARAAIATAAALAFVLASSAVAAADTGNTDDHVAQDQATDRPLRDRSDQPKDRASDLRPDRPTDRPTDRHGVNVNAIAPGGINTEGTAAPLAGSGMTEEEMQAMTEQFVAGIPLKRMGDPDDIATVAVFLAAPASDYVTGEIVVVDGGALIG